MRRTTFIDIFRRPARAKPATPITAHRIDFAGADSDAEVIERLRRGARAVAGADGICVVRRVGDEVLYVTEDAIAPLWTGQTFPLRSCVTGMALLANAPIVIPDIATDPRVPLHLYLATFVKSMAVFPIGESTPTMALSVYWRERRPASPEALARIAEAARDVGAALERVAAMAERRAG